MGALTKRGFLQQVANGEALRKAYGDGSVYKLLPPTWSSDVVRINSDDIERTLHSAQAMVAGLYPTTGKKDAPVEAHTKTRHNFSVMQTVCRR
jgi:hypothetical protein